MALEKRTSAQQRSALQRVRQAEAVALRGAQDVQQVLLDDYARTIAGIAVIEAFESLPDNLPGFIRNGIARASGRTLKHLMR